MPNAAKILLIEDDKELVEVIGARLVREGFEVEKAYDGITGCNAALSNRPSLILLDLMLPGMRGMDICKKLRSDPDPITRSTPVIMLTANADDADVVAGLEVGADDYVTKPFSLRQLVARIGAVMRRRAEPTDGLKSEIELGELHISAKSREVRVNGQTVPLTESEFRILHLLASQVGNTVSREELLKQISKNGSDLVIRNVDVHIGNLRRKVCSGRCRILTVRSQGYKLFVDTQVGTEIAQPLPE